VRETHRSIYWLVRFTHPYGDSQHARQDSNLQPTD
jgi:hypothetical protein